MSEIQENTTHFGFKTVEEDKKVELVAEVFHSVAAKYDVMNDVLSMGIHRVWKRFTIDCSGIRKGQKVLDLAGGTGDLTAKFSRIVGKDGQVILADINDSMLKVGRSKLRDLGVEGNVEYVQANAEELPFPDNHFDLVTIAFGLRNVTDKDKALASIYRVLKPGGRLLVLEFSKPLYKPALNESELCMDQYDQAIHGLLIDVLFVFRKYLRCSHRCRPRWMIWRYIGCYRYGVDDSS